MPLPSTYARALVCFSTPDNPGMCCVLWFRPDADSGDPATDCVALAEAIDDNCAANMRAVLSTQSSYLGVNCDLTVDNVAFNGVGVSNADAGLVTGDESSDGIAVSIRKKTAAGGPRGRGRWFMGAVPESLTDGSKLTDAGLAAYQGLGGTFMDDHIVAGIDYVSCLWSRSNSILEPITSVFAQRTMVKQFRRVLRPVI